MEEERHESLAPPAPEPSAEAPRQTGTPDRKWLIGAVLAGILIILGGSLFMRHGTVEAQNFCNTCHTAYYDSREYAFNDKVGMKKPSGMLTGCAECHPQPYAEFKKSAHFETRKLERRPGCANCHNDVHSIFSWYRFMYWQPVAWKQVQQSISDNGMWEGEVRPRLAGKARTDFVLTDSRVCRDCHNQSAKTFRPDIKAHKQAAKSGETCIKCHFNLVHAEVPWPDKDKK